MNKYTHTYINELQKNAFFGKILRGAGQLAKPYLDDALRLGKPHLDDAATLAKPYLDGAAAAGKSILRGGDDLVQGYGHGLGAMMGDYSKILTNKNKSIWEKVLGLSERTINGGAERWFDNAMNGTNSPRSFAGGVGDFVGAHTPLGLALTGLSSSASSFLPTPKENRLGDAGRKNE